MIVAETTVWTTRAALAEALQWGRDLIVAETLFDIGLRDRSYGASMGPRLDSRGNIAAIIESTLILSRLQWGRDLIVAETGKSGTLTTRTDELQWGRDLIVAETSLSSWWGCGDEVASMGPRLDSRGNCRGQLRPSRADRGFNGAAT